MPRPLPDPTPPSRATIRTIHQLGERIRATRAGEGMPIDQVARHCGVSIGMLSKLENDKGVNLEHALRVMDGLGLTMLVQFAVLIRREVKAWACRSRRQPYNCQSDSILEFVRWPRYSGLDLGAAVRCPDWNTEHHRFRLRSMSWGRSDHRLAAIARARRDRHAGVG